MVVCGNGVCKQGKNCRSCPDDCAPHLGAHVEAKDQICWEGGLIVMVCSKRISVGCDHVICNCSHHHAALEEQSFITKAESAFTCSSSFICSFLSLYHSKPALINNNAKVLTIAEEIHFFG